MVNTTFLKAEMQRILSLSEHEALELQNSKTESLDGLAFFPINSRPRDIQILFHKSKIDDDDTFKFIVFVFENNMSSICSWIFSSLNTGRILLRFLNESSKHGWSFIPSLRKKYLWYYFDITESKYLHLDVFPTRWNPWNTSIYHDSFPYFHFFRNLPQSQKLLKRSLKSSPSVQQPRPHNPLEPKQSTATLKRKSPTPNIKPPNYPENNLCHLSCNFYLPHQYRSNHLKKHTCLHSHFPPYFREQVRSYWASPHKHLERWLFASRSFIYTLVYITYSCIIILLTLDIYYHAHKEIFCFEIHKVMLVFNSHYLISDSFCLGHMQH